MDWSGDWLPAARDALVGLRGQGATDSQGLAVPALSVTDATATLAQLTRGVLTQLSRLKADGRGPACVSTLVNDDGSWDGSAPVFGRLPEQKELGGTERWTLTAEEYLSAYPAPDGTSPWNRSPLNYGKESILGLDIPPDQAAFARALAGEPDTDGGWVYTLYNGQNRGWFGTSTFDAGGQLFEMRELVACYQRACDAIATGAVSVLELGAPMPSESLLAFWHALLQVGASLDTLADVPPRPPTVEALKQAVDTAAEFVGDVAAKAANVAGDVIRNTAKGFFEGIGLPGLAVMVGVLAIYLALH